METATVNTKTGIEIVVNGESTIYRDAERAVIFITVSSESTSQDDVARNVTSTSWMLREMLTGMASKMEDGLPTPDAPITFWTNTDLSTGSYQHTKDDRAQLPRHFTASTRFEVKFRDFSRLGSFATMLSTTEHVSITNIDWHLTDATRGSLGRQSRQAALKDAITKAKDFADVLGKSELTITSISGGYSNFSFDSPLKARHGVMWSGAADPDGGAHQLSFEPQRVTLNSSIDVKFVASYQ